MIEINNLPILNSDASETGCCDLIKVQDWNEKTFILDDMRFAKASTKSFLYMPLDIGKVYTKVFNLINESDAVSPTGYLTLSKDESPWKAEHFFKVSKDVKGLEMVSLSGTFMTKVYDGTYKDIPKFIKDIKKYVSDNNKELLDIYSFYTLCPKCIKHYGHNYIILFAQIA